MPNAIKRSGEGLALQVTKPARAAGLVEENADGEPIRQTGTYGVRQRSGSVDLTHSIGMSICNGWNRLDGSERILSTSQESMRLPE